MEYRSLESITRPQLLDAWNGGFADYAVPMTMTEESLTRLLTARGYQPHVSAGAFDEGRLVGFVLNGLRPWRGAMTGYDTGTALLPDYRGKGIAKATMALALDLLRAAGATQYLLEVIQTNTPAVELYTKQGFGITREFPCLRRRHPVGETATWDTQWVAPFSPAQWREAEALWEVDPSWQSSPDTLLVTPEPLEYAVVRQGDALVGYGIFSTRSGTIAQMAVHPDFRRQGVGRSLLVAMAAKTEAPGLGFVNVDSGGQETMAALKALGFEAYIAQFEMVLPL